MRRPVPSAELPAHIVKAEGLLEDFDKFLNYAAALPEDELAFDERGEAMWRVEITYGGVTMVLKMTYDERNNRLIKFSRTGKIEATIYEEGASEGKRVKLDLGLLATIGEGLEDCKDCHEKRLAQAFTTASEKGFRWSVTSDRKFARISPGGFQGRRSPVLFRIKPRFSSRVAGGAPYEPSSESGQAGRIVSWARGRSRCESRTRLGGGPRGRLSSTRPAAPAYRRCLYSPQTIESDATKPVPKAFAQPTSPRQGEL